ncbi:MAG: formate dehydrogenase accessory protein FdhE, partial [Vicinamibacterales bacterium]
AQHVTDRRPLVSWADVPAEPGTLRLVLRQTGEVLSRFGLIEADAHARIQALARDGDVAAGAEAWFVRSCDGHGRTPAAEDDADQAIGLALKPFLSRCADAVQPAGALAAWTLNTCAVCGGEAEFGVIESADSRRLICGQCGLRWRFAPDRCPFCPHTGRAQLTTFATPDRQYQLTACEICRRYLKSYRSQPGRRPVMPAVDMLATLPLDAAAIQRGYGV